MGTGGEGTAKKKNKGGLQQRRNRMKIKHALGGFQNWDCQGEKGPERGNLFTDGVRQSHNKGGGRKKGKKMKATAKAAGYPQIAHGWGHRT